jgi:hypothetical protein
MNENNYADSHNNMFTPIPKSTLHNQKSEIQNIEEMMKSIHQFNEEYHQYLDCLSKSHNITESFDTISTPTFQPTYSPTNGSTISPTFQPTYSPTNGSTISPTFQPTYSPTNGSTISPTFQPTYSPTNGSTKANNNSGCVMPTIPNIPNISTSYLQSLRNYNINQDAIDQYNTNILKIRNELDSKLNVLYNTSDSFLSDYKMEFESTIYTGILWSILAGSILYYFVTRD